MLTITSYLKEIFEDFKKHCDEETQSMKELKDFMNGIKKNSPRNGADEMTSIYNTSAKLQLYLLKYAYAYGFEYLAMCNEFIKDFADKEEISVVSLGCGTMLEYWALANVLNMREKDEADKGEAEKKVFWPIVKYLGVDAIKWNYSMETEERDRDSVKFSQESFEHFFARQDNKFNTYDVYFFPKSISEFTNNTMELLLNNLSEIKKDTIYFCITLRKQNRLTADDVRKVQMIIDRLEEEKTGFLVKELKCIADTEDVKNDLKKCGLQKEIDNLIRLGANKQIWTTNIAKSLKYDEISYDDINQYIKALNQKCKHKSSKDKPCEGCRESDVPCEMNREQRMTNTKYICDLIIKFERR